MFALMNPKLIAALVLLVVASFAGGFLTKAYYAEIALAEERGRIKTKVETVEKIVKVTDTHQVQVLQAKLKKEKARADALAEMIKEEANANPPSVDCRVSDRLRESLNAALSAD